MTEQQNHLKSVIEQQNTIINEIQTINNQLAAKREMAAKLQGIIEYLTATGVKLPEEDKQEEETETKDTEVVSEPFSN